MSRFTQEKLAEGIEEVQLTVFKRTFNIFERQIPIMDIDAAAEETELTTAQYLFFRTFLRNLGAKDDQLYFPGCLKRWHQCVELNFKLAIEQEIPSNPIELSHSLGNPLWLVLACPER